MNRQKLFEYIKDFYGADPDYPWATAPESAVLRHLNSGKWFAAVLTPTRKQLGLTGDESIDVINLKCDPELSGALRTRDGIYPGYHMNKEHWISVVLDGTVSEDEIKKLIELSYSITAPKKKRTYSG